MDAQLCAQQQDGRQRAEARRFLEGSSGSKEQQLRRASAIVDNKANLFRGAAHQTHKQQQQRKCPSPTLDPELFDATHPEQGWQALRCEAVVVTCQYQYQSQLLPPSFRFRFVPSSSHQQHAWHRRAGILPKPSKLNRLLSEAQHVFLDFTRVTLADTFM